MAHAITDTSRPVAVEARGVSRTYHAQSTQPIHALRDVSCAFYVGEFTALMGRSGSGKSTFLHQLALLDRPTQGTVFLNGTDTRTLSPAQRSQLRLTTIGYVFQDYALVPELTLYENVLLPLLASRVVRSEDHKHVRDIISRVGLSHRISNVPAELSGGEQQRVSIARALVNRPAVLFADEPTANLDSESAETVLSLMRDLATGGQTIVMVTHEEDDRKYVDRVVSLRDGRIVGDERVQ